MNSIQILLVDKGNGRNEIRIALYYIIVIFFFINSKFLYSFFYNGITIDQKNINTLKKLFANI